MLPRKLTDSEKSKYPEIDNNGPYLWDNLRRRGGNSRPSDRPGQVFPLFISGNSVRVPKMDWDEDAQIWTILEEPTAIETEVWPIDPRGEDRIWRVNPVGAIREINAGNISVINKANRREIVKKSYMPSGRKPKTMWYDSKYSATTHGTKLLNDILGEQIFNYPKSVHLVADCLRFWANDKSTILDYFAGSGTTAHAAINLNREDGGQRKFILVEMGEYFDTVLLPRVKKITFTPEWKNGRPARDATPEEAERSPRVVKYVRIESYEDALDGISFDESIVQLGLEDRFGDDYLLRYMLRFETKYSPVLLNISDLESPFDYILRARSNGEVRELRADVAETFNYLIGLRVRRRWVEYDDGTPYLIFTGETRESPGKEVRVIWRKTAGWTAEDLEYDRSFLTGGDLLKGADTVYVNGNCIAKGVKALESLLDARMFARVNSA